MKNVLLSILVYLVAFAGPCSAQAPSDPFVAAMNSAWDAKDYPLLATTIDGAIQARPNDIAVLYAAYNYHLMISGDIVKLQLATNKIKSIADASTKQSIKALSEEIQDGLSDMIQEGLSPAPSSVLVELHKKFNREFPLISRGVRIQASLQN